MFWVGVNAGFETIWAGSIVVSDLPEELEAQPRLFFHLIGQAVSHIIFLVNHYELGWFRTNYRRITPRVLQQGDFLSYRINQ